MGGSGGCEGLHHTQRHGVEEEKRKTHPHRRDTQEVELALLPMCRLGAGSGRCTYRRTGRQVQLVPVNQQNSQHGKRQNPRRHQRHAPRKRHGQRHQHRGGQRPAQATGDAVHAVRMAQTRPTHLAVQQRVVHRVEHPVADTCHHREESQHAVAGAGGKPHGRRAQQGQPGKQDGARPEAVHHKTRRRLHGAGHDKKDGHQKAQLGVADLEHVLEPRKQRGQQQLAEMADHVGQTDQPDNTRVLAKRGRQGPCGGA